MAAGTLKPRAQPAEGVCYAPKIEKSEAPLDWSASAIRLDRQVRAFGLNLLSPRIATLVRTDMPLAPVTFTDHADPGVTMRAYRLRSIW